MIILALLPHEIAPSGPLVPVAFILLGLVFVIPLYVVRRRYGGTMLIGATIVEAFAGAMLAGTDGVLVPTAVGGAAVALILHLRALRRPDGHKLVDIGLAIAGFWVTLALFAIVSAIVLG